MKKTTFNGIIAGGVATFGVIASISSAFALYYKNPDDKKIDISLTTAADVSLQISDITKTGADALSLKDAVSRAMKYKYTLSGSNELNSTYSQKYVVGKLKVTLSTDNTKLFDNLTVSNVIDYTNKSPTAEKTETYYSKTTALNTMSFTLSADKKTYSGMMQAPVYVGTNDAGGIGNDAVLDIALKNTVTDANIIDIAEASFNIKIEFMECTDCVAAYVKGLDHLGWTEVDDGMMVPNIMSSKAEWMWTAGKDYGDSTFKCNIGEAWSMNTNGMHGGKANALVKADKDGNVIGNVKKGQSIYWTGAQGAEIWWDGFNAPAA